MRSYLKSILMEKAIGIGPVLWSRRCLEPGIDFVHCYSGLPRDREASCAPEYEEKNAPDQARKREPKRMFARAQEDLTDDFRILSCIIKIRNFSFFNVPDNTHRSKLLTCRSINLTLL